MLDTIENKIRLNAIVIYAIVAIICGGIIVYVCKVRNSIDTYKNQIEEYHAEISQIDGIIGFINVAQKEANDFISTKDKNHLENFTTYLDTIEHLLDSLNIYESESNQNMILCEINVLLREKEKTITQLNKQFATRDPGKPIREKLQTIEPVIQTDSVTVITSLQDTTIQVPTVPKKNFWRRLSNVFSPDKGQDTVVVVSIAKTDTLRVTQTDSIPLLSEVNTYAEQVQQAYVGRINAIQTQVNRLVLADQEISSNISALLIDLYRDSMEKLFVKIEENEVLIRKNNNISIAGSSIALVLILIFIVLIFNDVNKGYSARQSLEKANKRINQTMESRHKLLLSVSHDIKTPLNSILGYLELAEQPGKLTSKEIHAMKNSGNHILSLLENLLEFSGLEQGVLQSSPTPFHLHTLCKETAEMCTPLAKQKKLSFVPVFNFDTDVHVCCDTLKLKQIIINLLSNSIKYTQTGSVKFKVAYRENILKITATDTGIGIPEEQIDMLFKPFVRLDHDSMTEGTGFGMYVVKGLIELLDGEINVESKINQGTKITVILPAEKVVIKQPDSSLKLLLIDDEPSFLNMLRDLFTRLGHEADICSNEEEWNKIISQLDTYDMILTDMEMGTVSGKDVLSAIREINAGIPVVLMTARGDYNYHLAIKAGFTDYLRKPVTIASLQALLNVKQIENSDFVLLEEMFDHDTDAICEVLNVFIESTLNHMDSLREAVQNDDFNLSQSLCHKMLPMFMQIGAGEPVKILKKMDALRSEKSIHYPEWKTEMGILLQQSEDLIEKIQNTYPKVSSPILY